MTVFVGAVPTYGTFHRVFTIIACTSIVITAVYILRVVGKLLYGQVVNDHHLALTDANWYRTPVRHRIDTGDSPVSVWLPCGYPT